jgi:hypothetical protein
MRRFMVHLVTEVEFEDGDEASDKTVQNYQKHLSETVRNAAQASAPHRRRPAGYSRRRRRPESLLIPGLAHGAPLGRYSDSTS